MALPSLFQIFQPGGLAALQNTAIAARLGLSDTDAVASLRQRPGVESRAQQLIGSGYNLQEGFIQAILEGSGGNTSNLFQGGPDLTPAEREFVGAGFRQSPQGATVVADVTRRAEDAFVSSSNVLEAQVAEEQRREGSGRRRRRGLVTGEGGLLGVDPDFGSLLA